MTKWGDVAELATEELNLIEGVTRRMRRCIAVQRLKSKVRPKKKKGPERRGFNRRKGHHLMNGKTEVFQTEMALVSV